MRAALALTLLLLAAPAAAQTLAGSALRGHDTRAPVDVNADRVEVLDREQQAVFTGNVRVRQGTLILDASRIRVLYSRQGAGDPQIRRLDADGNVRLTSPSEQASARFAIYDVDNRLITLIGNVRLANDKTSVSGNRLVIDLDSGRSTLDGRAGGGEGASRVQGRFAVPARRN
jgi:lipopolysaccharide export system protein LptA